MTLFRSLPAAVALAASALVAPLAVAQPDPAAKSALEASAAAVKANPTMRFMAKAFLEGAAGVRMGGEAQVTILRGAASPGGTSMAFKGTIDALDGVSDVWSSIIEGRTLLYVDTPGKRLVEKPMVSGADVAKNATRPRDYLIAPPLLDGEPFQVDLRAREIVFDGEKDVRGELCTVIRCVIEPKHTERVIYLSKKDNLPRRYEQVRLDGGRKARVWEIWNLETGLKITAKDLRIPLPPGYTEVKEAAPAAPANPANPANPAAPAPAAAPGVAPGGLSKGADAPGFTLAKADGSGNVSLGQFKGKVAVVGFWGPIFDSSKQLAGALQGVQQQFGDKIAVVGIACRQGADSADTVRTFLSTQKATFPAALAGDSAAAQYNVRGFPSVCIITPDGKVAAFVEGAVSAEMLAGLVESALKPAGN